MQRDINKLLVCTRDFETIQKTESTTSTASLRRALKSWQFLSSHIFYKAANKERLHKIFWRGVPPLILHWWKSLKDGFSSSLYLKFHSIWLEMEMTKWLITSKKILLAPNYLVLSWAYLLQRLHNMCIFCHLSIYMERVACDISNPENTYSLPCDISNTEKTLVGKDHCHVFII